MVTLEGTTCHYSVAILTPYISWSPYSCECLPCMTPDKRWILFNSDYPGVHHYKGARHTA